MILSGVGNTNKRLRSLRVGAPDKLVMWRRWWEPIDNILEQGRSIDSDMGFYDRVVDFAFELSGQIWLREHGIPQYPMYQDYKTPPTLSNPNGGFDFDKLESERTMWGIEYSARIREKIGPDKSRKELLLKCLDEKRADDNYDQILGSIERYGFRRCVTVERRSLKKDSELGYIFGDGHHRLAAAIDLEFTHVPVQLAPKYEAVASDSGSWCSGDVVHTTHRKALNSQ